ncbi:MAG: O-antigen ligase family protein [Stigonema ocellatum SAG 48.90 = DSM 106950]|nr:O-antigen ligase family protein [Stigonema ocellatum SAG 48.90 = DSM 106950]
MELSTRVNSNAHGISLLKASETGIIIFFLLFGEASIPSSIKALIQLANYIFVAIVLVGQWKKIAYVMTRDVSLTLLILINLLSVFWSVNISRTLRLDIAFIRITLMGVYLTTRYCLKDQVRLISWVSGLLVVINLFVCVVFPSYGIGVNPNDATKLAWTGIYGFKQFLGRIMALTASIFIAHLLNKDSNRWLALVGVIFSIAMLLLSDSKTYLIATVVCILLLPIYKIAKQRATLRAIMLFFVLVIVVATGYLVAVNIQTISTNFLGKGESFNGRTPIWTLAIQKLMDRPWLGYGYGAFWPSEFGEEIARETWIGRNFTDLSTLHAHNTFLEIGLEIGLIGLTLLLFNITMVLRRVFKLLHLFKTLEFFWMLEFLAIQLVGSMSEQPTYLSPYHIYWIIYVMIAFSTARELSRIKQKLGYINENSPSSQHL